MLFNKGDHRLCGNYRSMSLLANILLSRLIMQVEVIITVSQCGFGTGRSTTFAIRQFKEKSRKENPPLGMVFIDFTTKACVTVERNGLRTMQAKYGCPRHLATMIKALHEGMQVRVRRDGDTPMTFSVENGVKRIRHGTDPLLDIGLLDSYAP